MVVAIVLFVGVMSLILWLIDRPKVPNWLVVVGFLGPVTHRAWPSACSTRHWAPSCGRSRSAQAAVGPDGKPIINPTDRPEIDRAGLQSGQLRQGLHRPELPEGADQHRLVGHPGAGGRHRLRPDLRGAGRPDPRREAGQGAGLPADGDLDGRRLHHLEVRVRVPPGGRQIRSAWSTRYWCGSVSIPTNSSSPNRGTRSS